MPPVTAKTTNGQNSRRSAWGGDRWLWKERLWEKEGRVPLSRSHSRRRATVERDLKWFDVRSCAVLLASGTAPVSCCSTSTGQAWWQWKPVVARQRGLWRRPPAGRTLRNSRWSSTPLRCHLQFQHHITAPDEIVSTQRQQQHPLLRVTSTLIYSGKVVSMMPGQARVFRRSLSRCFRWPGHRFHYFNSRGNAESACSATLLKAVSSTNIARENRVLAL